MMPAPIARAGLRVEAAVGRSNRRCSCRALPSVLGPPLLGRVPTPQVAAGAAGALVDRDQAEPKWMRRAADVAEEDAVREAVAAVRKAGRIDVDDAAGRLTDGRHGRRTRTRGPGGAYSACSGDVAAAVGEVLAVHRRDVLVAAEAVSARRRPGRGSGSRHSLAQDEVDDAGDGVRTVNRRVAAGDDVDALDQVVRDRVDVGRHGIVEDVGGDVAAAVDQHQGALRAEAAKIEQVEAGDADAEARVLLARRCCAAAAAR